jgi:hypothetical protein
MEMMKQMARRGPGGQAPPLETKQPGGADTTARPGQVPQKRTEFVVLFIWREPTPSDAHLEIPAADTQAAQPGTPTGSLSTGGGK